MNKNFYILISVLSLTGCMAVPYIGIGLSAAKEAWDGWESSKEESVNKKICSAIEQEFSKTSDSWQAYQNVIENIYSQVDEDEKPDASKDLKEIKAQFASINSQPLINKELYKFKKNVKVDFKCSEEIRELVDSHIEQYDSDKRTEEQNRQWEELAIQMQKAEKKYGYKFCADEDIMPYFITGRPLPTGCILAAGEQQFLVFQQVRGGTLLQSRTANYIPGQIVFVTNNKTDSGLPDGVAAPGGYFVRTGSFNYNSVLGAGKTVYKLKRLEAF